MKLYPNSNYRSIMKRSISFVSIIVMLILTFGCASVNRLREAQDTFNQTVASENALRFDSNPADTAANLGSVRSGYASALLSLGKIEDADKDSLEKDKLWGTALTLKALCQWRLGMFPEALSTAKEAQEKANEQVYPRDRAVLTALPGLIKTDQAYDKITRISPSTPDADKRKCLTDVEELLIGERGAIANIQDARNMADKNHPVQIYLVQAQLAAYRNYMVAKFRLENLTVDPESPVKKNADVQLQELVRLLKDQDAPTAQRLIDYWAKLCGLTLPG